MQKILRIDPKDNLIVALRDLAQGDIIENDGQRIQLVTDVPAKHKFTTSHSIIYHAYGFAVKYAYSAYWNIIH